MITILTKIWGILSGKVGEWLGIAAAILTSIALIRKSGADSVIMRNQAQTLKNVEVKNEVENSISKLSDADVADQLRKQGQLRD